MISVFFFLLFNFADKTLGAEALEKRHLTAKAALEKDSLKVHQKILTLGSQDQIVVRGKVLVPKNSIFRIDDLGPNLQLTGQKEGFAHFSIGNEIYHIHVLSPEKYRAYQNLKLKINQMRGLRVEVENGEVLVHGRLLRAIDWLELYKLDERKFRFKAQVSEELEDHFRSHFKEKIKKAGLAPLSLNISYGATATVAKEHENYLERYKDLLDPYGIDVRLSTSSVFSLEPLVRTQIMIAEVKRSNFHHLGIAWPDRVEASILPKVNLPTDLSVELQALEQKGEGQILASPTLLCRSGKEAEFHSGGEFPIRLIGRATKEVVWKRHGLYLQIKPLADANGRMSIAIQTEISVIDQSQTVDGVPGLLSNRVQSHFDLIEGATVALSGLVREEWAKSVQGLPGLSQIPLLGRLFSSRSYLGNKSELIIFVSPTVILPDEINEPAKPPSSWKNFEETL